MIACSKDPEPSPLLGTWNFTSGKLNMKYVANGIFYNLTGPVRASETYTFTSDNQVDILSSARTYAYTTANIDGEDQITITEKNNGNAIPMIYSWKVEGSTLTLTSKNILAGKSPSESITYAKLFGGVIAASSTSYIFPNYQNITSVNDIVSIYSYTKK